MRKAYFILAMLVLAGTAPVFAVQAEKPADGKAAFKYGGVATCKACHFTKKSGAQYKVWKAGPHAKAFATLQTPEAKEVGRKLGVADPATSDKCLKCHVTAFGVAAELKGPKLKQKDGVGCESCHGPGSAYKKKKIMTDIRAGKVDRAKYGLVKPTKETCMQCHNEESPSYKSFNFEEAVAKIAHPMPPKK